MPQSALDIVRSVWERLTTTPLGTAEPAEVELLVRLVRNFPGMAYRCRLDRSWTMEYVSPGCRALTGFDARDLVGNRVLSYASLIHPDDRDRVWDAIRRAVRANRTFRVGYRIRRVDGTERHVRELGAAKVGVGGEADALEGYVMDVTDVTGGERVVERHGARREPDGEKMEALARLAAGVAHDLNNVLTAIIATAQVVARQEGLPDLLTEDLGEILKAAERGAASSRELMAFGRGRAAQIIEMSPGDVLDRSRATLEAALPADVRLEIAVAPRLPSVEMDPAHFEQLVEHLVLNARDAMPDGGRIDLELRPAERPGDRPSGVVLEVRDDGDGIAPDVMDRIFEPFFTTKGRSSRGLGLARVWRIVRSVDGAVEVDSEPGTGSTFRVLLPARGPVGLSLRAGPRR